ncbi:MAG: Mut7-C RNAse domain-containing protein, partial [Limisphaerales bacterium]
IRAAYEMKFRQLLEPLHPRKLEKAMVWFSRRAERLSQQANILLPVAFHRVHEEAQRKLRKQSRDAAPGDMVFWCDAGLGGLARWLRAAGYEAHWKYGIDDAELLRRAERISAIVLTTDSGMMERGILRDGHLRSLWLPPALHIPEQLAAVFAAFRLERRPSRCTECSGVLIETPKESIRDRIPPKTYLWLDHYWTCERCGKLFWNGTHWRKLHHELERIAATS